MTELQQVSSPDVVEPALEIVDGKPDLSRYNPYEGRELVPSTTICGWCMERRCVGCKVWMSSPGTHMSKTHEGMLPCVHPCTKKKLKYLRTIFGRRWTPEHSIPKRRFPVLRIPHDASSVRVSDQTNHNKEVAVSDTTSTKTKAPAKKASAPVSRKKEPSTPKATAPTVASDRAPRTDLEPDVKKITDKFVNGKVKVEEGKFLTPHLVATLIQKARGADKPPSTGAVQSVFARWEKIGFAVVNPKPFAFLDYTDAGRSKGLAAMKQEYRDTVKAEKAAAKATASAK